MGNVRKLEVSLLVMSVLGDPRQMGFTNISTHMIVSPSLKGGPRVISMFTVDLDEFVKHTPSEIEIFVAKMFTQNQEDLTLVLPWCCKRRVPCDKPGVSHLYTDSS